MIDIFRKLHTNLRLLSLLLILIPLHARDLPKELDNILDALMGMERTSVDIRQVIHWRFFGGVDSMQAHLDIRSSTDFRLSVPLYGLDVYGKNDSLITINHGKKQILIESADRKELLDQLFIGGDLSSARLKKTHELGNNKLQYDFTFRDEYSEWEHMKLTVSSGRLQKIELRDYDRNRYYIYLEYVKGFRDFQTELVLRNRWQYEIADLRR